MEMMKKVAVVLLLSLGIFVWWGKEKGAFAYICTTSGCSGGYCEAGSCSEPPDDCPGDADQCTKCITCNTNSPQPTPTPAPTGGPGLTPTPAPGTPTPTGATCPLCVGCVVYHLDPNTGTETADCGSGDWWHCDWCTEGWVCCRDCCGGGGGDSLPPPTAPQTTKCLILMSNLRRFKM